MMSGVEVPSTKVKVKDHQGNLIDNVVKIVPIVSEYHSLHFQKFKHMEKYGYG